MNSTTRSSAPTVSAHCSTMASCSWRSTAAAAPSTSPTTRAVGHPDAVEAHGGEAAHEVDRTEGFDRARPAARAGTRNWVRPPSVRAVTSSSSACAAASTGVATPSSTNSSPSRRAVTAPPVPSHPPPGPAPHHAPTTSPAMIPGSTAARSSGVPPRLTASATTLVGASGPGDTRRPISSATMHEVEHALAARGCRRRRPRRRGATSTRARQPRAHQPRSKPAGSSASARTAVSGISCSRNLRVVSWKNCWSSLSARFIGTERR